MSNCIQSKFTDRPGLYMYDNTPATKGDITQLMDSIGKLYDANENWKDEIIRHFDVTERRIGMLERHTGLIAA